MTRIQNGITGVVVTTVLGLSTIVTPVAANASEEGRRNTALALGAAAIALLVTQQHHHHNYDAGYRVQCDDYRNDGYAYRPVDDGYRYDGGYYGRGSRPIVREYVVRDERRFERNHYRRENDRVRFEGSYRSNDYGNYRSSDLGGSRSDNYGSYRSSDHGGYRNREEGFRRSGR